MEYQSAFGVASVVIGLLAFGLYYRSIFRGITKPHVFTWAAFALLDAIVFFAQVSEGAGPGAWAVGLGAIACAGVAVLSLRVGHLEIKRSDWVAFAGALLGIALWIVTDHALYAVALATAVNLIALYPTLRKSYAYPESESVSVWAIDVVRYGLSLFALAAFNLTTALFPAAIIVGNSAVVLTVLLRRRRHKQDL